MTSLGLRAGSATASITTTGAETVGWTIDDRAILWPGDDRWWQGSAPVLFPVCGAPRNGLVRYADAEIEMPLHGFAKAAEFTVEDRSDDAVTLSLADDEDTRAVFPYPFRLTIRYTLTETTLTQTLTVTNTGSERMPYSLGVHPGFTLADGTGEISFEHPESADVPVVVERLFSEMRQPSQIEGTRLSLSPALFERVASLCLLNAASRSLSMTGADGHGLTVDFDGFPHIVLWAPSGAPFVAIEGWTGHGDPTGYDGQFGDRPSTSWLSPGASATYSAAFTAF
ncbi:hypothetical protein [Psychromarinibacter sp. S121]|uniref:aldose epimerase family protein n=1 Tax=Psychromarinibacter sp. S121 TaxID=3415127 RepID=UPI003C7B4CD9